jgi:hypothetical protein
VSPLLTVLDVTIIAAILLKGIDSPLTILATYFSPGEKPVVIFFFHFLNFIEK